MDNQEPSDKFIPRSVEQGLETLLDTTRGQFKQTRLKSVQEYVASHQGQTYYSSLVTLAEVRFAIRYALER